MLINEICLQTHVNSILLFCKEFLHSSYWKLKQALEISSRPMCYKFKNQYQKTQ